MSSRKYVNVNRTRWAYVEFGSRVKPPLVLLHGMNSFADYFSAMIPYLSQDFRIIIPDIPGFGYSEPLKNNTYRSVALQVSEFCRALKLPKISVFGTSAGGTVALALALEKPELVERLIVQSPLWRGRAIQYGIVEKFQSQCIHIPTKILSLMIKPAILIWLLKSVAMIKPRLQVVIKYYANLVVESIGLINVTAAKTYWTSLQQVDLTNSIGKINLPVLCITGTDDDLIPAQETLSLAKTLKYSDLVAIDNSGHELIFQKPQTMSNIIKSYVVGQDKFKERDVHWLTKI